MMKFYAVARGRATGIFRTWSDAKSSVHGVSGALVRSFTTEADAKAYLKSCRPLTSDTAVTSAIGAGAGAGFLLGAAASSSGASRGHGSLHHSFLLRFDGACTGNPGPGGAGALIYGLPPAVAGELTLEDAAGRARGWEPVWFGCQKLDPNVTNNVAEYEGLILGLLAVRRVGLDRDGAQLTVQGDSELIIRQVRGEYEVKAEHLKPLHRKVTKLLAELSARNVRVTLGHVLRACNAEADRLSNEGLLGTSSKITDALTRYGGWESASQTAAPPLAGAKRARAQEDDGGSADERSR